MFRSFFFKLIFLCLFKKKLKMEKVKSEPYGPIIIMNFKVSKINLFILKSLSLSLFFIFIL